MGFVLHRTDISEGLMQPLPIIEHLNELENLRPSVLTGTEPGGESGGSIYSHHRPMSES